MKTFFEWLVLHESLKDYFGRLGNNWQEVDKLAAEAIKGWMDWSGGDGDVLPNHIGAVLEKQ